MMSMSRSTTSLGKKLSRKLTNLPMNIKNKKRLVIPLDYNPFLPNQNKVLKKHHRAMTIKNTSLKEVFPDPPMAAFHQGPNLRRLLCRARLSPLAKSRPTRATQTSPGWRKCAKNRKPCPACPFAMDATSQILA